MYKIHPVCEETILPHIGRQACIIANDGTQYCGVIHCIQGGKIYLATENKAIQLSSVNGKPAHPKCDKHKFGKKNKQQKVNSSCFGAFGGGCGRGLGGCGRGFGGYGCGCGVEIALIAGLFLLPLLCI